MADVFISYSQKDRLLVEQLAAELESEGWSIWFDRGLTAGVTWRDEIATELAEARAVLVLWTQTSIKSNFVRAEAERAKADAKLIQVKASGVEYGDIPLPFGEMYIEAVENRELIRAAVETQLAKWQVLRRLWRATAGVLYAVLTWGGIIGAAITVFGNLERVFELADWARLMVQNWSAWTHAFWRWPLAWIGIELPRVWSPILTFAACAILTIAGGKLSGQLFGSKDAPHLHEQPGFRLSPLMAFVGTLVTAGVGMLATVGSDLLGLRLSRLSELTFPFLLSMYVVLFASRGARVQAMASLILFWPLAFILLILPTLVFGVEALLESQLSPSPVTPQSTPPILRILSAASWNVLLWSIVPVALTQISARRLNQRLLFILVGVAALVSLNGLSKLNLGQYLSAGG